MTDVVTGTQPRWRLTADLSLPAGSLDPSATLSGNLQGWQFLTGRSAPPVSGPDGSTWPERASGRLGELAGLPPGWDGESARATSPAILVAVRKFVLSDLVAGLAVKPDLVPTV
ncbi:MAG: hypothetical protein ACYDH5_19995, partial [Acidimicrobiales bacterium]